MASAWALLWNLTPLLLALLFVGWLYWRWLKVSDDPVGLTVRCIITAVLLGGIFSYAARAARRQDEFERGIAVILSLFGGLGMIFIWRQQFCDFVGDLFAGLYTGGSQEVDPAPFYSIANAKRKQGKYSDAIAEIRVQLERFPDDFQGWMFLAEIQAEDLKDIPAAHETVDQLVSQPGHSPKNIAYALNREADWHLKLGHDRESARAALDRILEMLPDSEQAQLALQRISHLTPQAMLDESENARPMTLKAGAQNIGLRKTTTDLVAPDKDPAETAAEYVRHLDEHPYDNEAREKLALIYAKHYRRLDLASDQLEQLIAWPNQPAKQVIHWLNLLADQQIDLAADTDQAKVTLQRIVQLYPKTAAAENAEKRIAHLKLELRSKQQRQAVRLGTYEQNIGLKGGGGTKEPGVTG